MSMQRQEFGRDECRLSGEKPVCYKYEHALRQSDIE